MVKRELPHRILLSVRLWLIILLLAHVALLSYEAFSDSPTLDEVAHLPAGIHYLRTGEPTLYRVNPPLVRAIAAVPVLLWQPIMEWLDGTQAQLGRPEFNVGRRFCELNAHRIVGLFRVARLTCIVFSCIGYLFLIRWSGELYGDRASLVAAVAWAFSPNILAHGHLLTPDIAATSLGLAAAYAFARWLKQPNWCHCLIAGSWMGLACLTKMTWILLFGLWPVIYLAMIMQFKVQTWRTFLQLCLMLLTGLTFINHGYGWSGSLSRLESFHFESRTLAGHNAEKSNRFAKELLGRLPVPLPSDYVRGIDKQKCDFERGFESYLNGCVRHGGWWYYYIWAVCIKTPIGLLALVAIGISAHIRRVSLRVRLNDYVVLSIVPISLFVLVSSQTGFSHHLRYVLPVYPFAFIWASGSATTSYLFVHRMLLPAALALIVASSLCSYPHTLAYFNELVGGPQRGHYYLVDSNIDWGQDMLYLKQWDRCRPNNGPLFVACFGCFDPMLLDVDYRRPPICDDVANLPPGLYVISVHRLHGLQRVMMPNGLGEWTASVDCSVFLECRPIARIGYSMLVYRVEAPAVGGCTLPR